MKKILLLSLLFCSLNAFGGAQQNWSKVKIYLDVKQGKETSTSLFGDRRYESSIYPSTDKLVEMLRERGWEESLEIEVFMKEKGVDFSVILDFEGWVIANPNTGAMLDSKEKAILFDNVIKDIVLSLRHLVDLKRWREDQIGSKSVDMELLKKKLELLDREFLELIRQAIEISADETKGLIENIINAKK
ncbi:hypothetical protein MYX78_04815 [Acidobacteria bacterium AH-259-G07]|nr:hypothetical protein [Acidobacteria bacterium AH-259-G07]